MNSMLIIKTMILQQEGECVDGKLACPNCGVNLKVKTVLTAVAAAQIKEEVDVRLFYVSYNILTIFHYIVSK